MLDEALSLARRGFKVIPCKDKHPFIKGWTKKATTNEATIKKLWNGENYNIAILTGNGFIVIDCDIKNDCNGLDNFVTFMKDNEITIPNTLTVTTGSGGKHFYFKTDKLIQNSVSQFLDNVDIRGVNGCVIAPPSLHPNGNRYKWDNDYDVAPLPKELEELFTSDDTKNKTNNIKRTPIKYGDNLKIVEGDRNNFLFRLSCKLVEFGLSYDSLLKLMESENKSRCEPPLSDDELKTLVNSSFKYHRDRQTNSTSLIFSGKYNPTTIAIYWFIWYYSVFLCNDTIYINQSEICKQLGIKSEKTFRNNVKPLIGDLVEVKHTYKTDGNYGVNSYRIL